MDGNKDKSDIESPQSEIDELKFALESATAHMESHVWNVYAIGLASVVVSIFALCFAYID